MKMTLETESMEVSEEKKVGKEELTVQFTSEKGEKLHEIRKNSQNIRKL